MRARIGQRQPRQRQPATATTTAATRTGVTRIAATKADATDCAATTGAATRITAACTAAPSTASTMATKCSVKPPADTPTRTMPVIIPEAAVGMAAAVMAADMEAGDERADASTRPRGARLASPVVLAGSPPARPRSRRARPRVSRRRCGRDSAHRGGAQGRRQGDRGDAGRMVARLRAQSRARFRPRAHALSRGLGRQPQGHVDGDRAIVEVGKTGWTLPIPIVKDGAEWRFDSEAGIDELGAREIGRDELGAIQTLLAIVDAQREYAAMDPMKTGSPVYARRLKSLPGKKDGLYWPASARRAREPAGRTGRQCTGRRHRAGRPLRLQFPPALRPGTGGARRRPPAIW